MKHRVFGRKLNRDMNSRKALISNLAADLFLKERIQTTEAKAKTVKPVADKLITLAQKGSLDSRRRLAAILGEDAAKKAVDILAPRYGERSGGYVRSFRLGRRLSDSSEMMILEMVDAGKVVAPIKAAKAATTKKAVKKATPKKTKVSASSAVAKKSAAKPKTAKKAARKVIK